MKANRMRSVRYLPLAVIALATTLTLNGITHDLPYSYNTDEAHFVKRALAFGSGDLNPHWFHKPAFYMYLLFVEYGGLFVVGWLSGTWESVSDFAVGYVRNPGPFYLLGRLTSAAFGVGTVLGVYFLGERHFSKHAGLIGAALLALTMGHLESSRVVKADIPTTFFSVWSLYFALNYLHDRRWRNFAACCALAGIGTATKYYSIAMLVPISALVAMVPLEPSGLGGQLRARGGRWAAALVIFFAAYFVASPYNFLDPLGREATSFPFRTVWDKGTSLLGYNVEERPGDFINQRTSILGGGIDYVRVLASHRGMGPVAASLGLLGMLTFLDPRNRAKLLVLLFAGTFALASIAMFPGYAQPRHQCPLYPLLALAGGVVVTQAASWRPRYASWIYAGLAVALCYPLAHVAHRGRELSREGTRNVAKAWIEQNLPAKSRLLVDENGPPLLPSEEQLLATLDEAREADANGQFTAHYSKYVEYQLLAAQDATTFELHEIRLPWWREQFDEEGLQHLDTEYDRDISNPLRPVGVEGFDYYLDNGFQYAVVHSNRYGKFYRQRDNYSQRYPAFADFYRNLFARATLIKEFSPRDGALRGPVVRVYRLPTNSNAAVVDERPDPRGDGKRS